MLGELNEQIEISDLKKLFKSRIVEKYRLWKQTSQSDAGRKEQDFHIGCMQTCGREGTDFYLTFCSEKLKDMITKEIRKRRSRFWE